MATAGALSSRPHKERMLECVSSCFTAPLTPCWTVGCLCSSSVPWSHFGSSPRCSLPRISVSFSALSAASLLLVFAQHGMLMVLNKVLHALKKTLHKTDAKDGRKCHWIPRESNDDALEDSQSHEAFGFISSVRNINLQDVIFLLSLLRLYV